MELFEMVAPCLLGVEGLVGEELREMQAAEVRPENGRVFFKGDERMLARALFRPELLKSCFRV